MRIVIDTNIFVSSFFSPEGNPRVIIDLWKSGKAILCVTEDILEEYVEVLARLGLAEEPELQELLQLFQRRSNIVYVTSAPNFSVIAKDPDDDKFVGCAVVSGAKIVISGDKHLQDLKSFKDIQILSPVEFLKRYRSGVLNRD